MAKKSDAVNTSGKRKTAIARATVKKGKGLVRINNIPLSLHQPEISRWKILEPITLSGDMAESVNIDVDVQGGGFMSQANAIRTAIARGLVAAPPGSESGMRYGFVVVRTFHVPEVLSPEDLGGPFGCLRGVLHVAPVEEMDGPGVDISRVVVEELVPGQHRLGLDLERRVFVRLERPMDLFRK